MKPAIRSLSAAVALIVASLACGGGGGDPAGPGPGPGPNPTPGTVSMTATSFTPSSISIQSGGTVTWNNGSGVPHNVTFTTSGSPANIPDHTSGSTSRTFANNGSFSYNCTNHSGMVGTVVVQ